MGAPCNATPPSQLSITWPPPQCQAASLPNYLTHRCQLMPDLLSVNPPWTLNPRWHHRYHQCPHPRRWMWMRPLPRPAVKISGRICLQYTLTKHLDVNMIHIPIFGLHMGFILWGCKSQTLPGLCPMGEGVNRIYSTTLLILLQHRVLQYFLLYIEQKLHGPLWVH